MGFEPTTPTLARLCSTPELHPHPQEVRRPRPPPKLCQRAAGLATAWQPFGPIWPFADIPYVTFNVAIGGKADILSCTAHVRF